MNSLRPLLAAFLILCCNGCAVQTPAAARAKAPGISFLALGDSYTFGEGVPDAAR